MSPSQPPVSLGGFVRNATTMKTPVRPTPHPLRDAAAADEGRRGFVRQL
ncbi:hypothetical protein AcdelDRAFT_2013, partial [Acidovorax delafieldii 2AN]